MFFTWSDGDFDCLAECVQNGKSFSDDEMPDVRSSSSSSSRVMRLSGRRREFRKPGYAADWSDH